MPVVLAGLADFAAAALAAMEAVAAFLLAVAAVYMWVQLVRPIFVAISKVLPGGWSVLGHTVVPNLKQDWLNLEHAVYVALITWREGAEIEVAYTWHWMGQAWRWNAGMVEWLAKETDAGFEWLSHLHLPKWTKYAILAPLLPLLLPKVLRYVLAHVHVNVHKQVQVIERTLPGKTLTIVRHTGAVAIPDVWRIPGFAGVWHGLTRRWARINWRLRRLEGLLTVAGFAAAMAAVFGVVPSCLKRNGNIGRVARGICGLGPRALEDLLGLLVDVVIVSDICQVVNLLESGLEIIQGPIDSLVSVVGGSLCHGDYNAPPDVGPFDNWLPPVSGYTLSLA